MIGLVVAAPHAAAAPGTATPTSPAPPASPAPPTSPATTDLCHDDPSRTPSTMTVLACSLRDGLPPLDPRTLVVSRPLTEGSAEGANAFATRLTSLLSNATHTRDGGIATTPSAQQGAEAVLVLEAQLHGTLVQVNATLIGKRANVWARLRGASHQVLAHAFVSKPLDAEVRSYLPKVPLVRPKVALFRSPLTQLNAIACADVDADGALDVALANRREVAWGTLTADGFSPVRGVPLGQLSGIAPVPLREPLTSLWFNGSTLEFSSTDRHHWLQLDAALEPLAKRPNQWGIGPGLCATRTAADRPTTFPCDAASASSDATSVLFDRAVAMAQEKPGQPTVAWRDATTATLTIQTTTRTWTLAERGAQVALHDLDHDGILEVVSTSASLSRNDDEIAVHSLRDDAREPRLEWSFPVTTGVDAVAVCPMDGPSQSAILFASNDHVGVAQ